jgi:hypothetical protein
MKQGPLLIGSVVCGAFAIWGLEIGQDLAHAYVVGCIVLTAMALAVKKDKP